MVEPSERAGSGVPRVLVVGGDAEWRDFARRALDRHHLVEAADDGPRALEIARQDPPDAMLLARTAPPLDGLGLLKAMRSDARLRGVPVVLVSSPDEEAWRVSGLEAGADDHAVLPCSARELLARVARRIQRARRHIERARQDEELRVEGRRSREALRESEERFRTFIHQSRDGIVVIDGRGTILEWNDGAAEITGIPRSEAVDQPIWEVQQRLTPPEQRDPHHLRFAKEKVLAGLEEGVRLRRTLEDEIQRPDGSRRNIESVLFGVQKDGRLFAAGISRDVTHRKRADEMLRASERRLSLALEASGQGLWDWDIASDTAYLSPEYLRLTGYSEGEVSSALAFFRSTVHRDDLPAVERAMEEHFRGATPRSIVEYRLRRESGEFVWIRGVGQITARDRDGAPLRMTGVIADVTPSKRLEEELRERQALLLEAERLAHLGHWDRDLRTGRSHWSDEIYRILGYHPGSITPSREAFLRALAPEDRERMAEAVAATARDGERRRYEYRVANTPRGPRYVMGIVELLRDARGAPARLIGTAQDITERKLMEQTLAEANRRKDDFLAVLSHELRNPLAPVRSSLDVLARTPPGGEQAKRMLGVIERQVTYLTRLVDDLLDVTRIARGKIQLHREVVEFVELVRRSVEDHRLAFTAAGVHLEAPLASTPMWLDADPTRVAQIIGNLLGNAAKFTPTGGHVQVLLEDDGGAAVLTVSDDGIGIPPEVVGRIFEPFIQADRTLDRARGGLGLGLALVKGLAELHGGTVAVSSDGPGKGARFAVRLPTSQPAAAAAKARVAPPVRTRRVLLIEDNIDGAASLKEALEIHGHQVEVAYNGPDGISRARAFAPEIVLCDIGLPVMNGYEVARAIRADRTLQNTFLVALSGYALPEDVQRATQAGFQCHLAKPVPVEQLAALLDEGPGTEGRAAQAAEPRPSLSTSPPSTTTRT